MSEHFRLGVIGGSFDPIHLGHLAIAEEARERFGLKYVVFVPARVPPHKDRGTAAPAADRLEMVKIAVRPEASFLASDIEMRREGPSYTIDTLEEIGKLYPEADVRFIVGEDSLAELHSWHRARELVERFGFIIVARPGSQGISRESLEESFGEEPAGKLLSGYLSTEIFRVSATEIRKRVREGRSVRFLLPGGVERYIVRRGLYR